ncbi:MAG: hypothetical protein AB1665_07130 [Candidatus Thermoplasmatota archaeon]
MRPRIDPTCLQESAAIMRDLEIEAAAVSGPVLWREATRRS